MNQLGGFWNEGAAELLRQALEKKGLTVEALAEELRITSRTVRYWMRTNERPVHPHVGKLPALCAAVGVTQDEFWAAAEAYRTREETRAALPQQEAVSRSAIVPAESASDTPPAIESPASLDRRLRKLAMSVLLAALVIVPIIAGLLVLASSQSPHRLISSYSIPSSDVIYEGAWAGRVSPDGRYIAFMAVARPAPGLDNAALPPRRLFILSTERQDRAIPVIGSEGTYTTFFWDDASSGLYFIRAKKLMHVSIDGGPAKEIASVDIGTLGDANSDGEIVLGSRRGLIFVSPAGRVHLRASSWPHLFPTFLPDGERFLFLEQRRDANGNAIRDLYLMSLREQVPKLIARNVPSRVEYNRGHVLYVRDCALLARQFDLASGRLATREHKVKDDVWMEDKTGSASFSTSRDGVLVTQGPPVVSPVELVQVTTRGTIRTPVPKMGDVRNIAVTPNRDALVLGRIDRCRQTQTLWRWPLTDRAPQCLTCGRGTSTSPVLAPDGRTLYFAASRGNVMGIFSIAMEDPREERLVYASPHFPAPRAITRQDDRLVIEMTTADRDGSLWTIPLRSAHPATPLVVTPEMEGESARFSPDGQWLAFSALRESGSGVLLLRTGQPPNEARLVGPQGWRCRWSEDGTKLYYARGNAVMEYDLALGSTRTLFERDGKVTEIAVMGSNDLYVVTTAEAHNRVDGDWTRVLSARR